MLYNHTTSMLIKAIKYLNCKPGKVIVDATLGGFGHADIICDKIHPNGILIGIDQDIDAIKNAKIKAKKKKIKTFIKHTNFIFLDNILEEINISSIDGILIDIGLSLHQIKSSGRGFSFLKNEPLDMRMNVKNKVTASYILSTYKKKEISNIFKQYGEEPWANKIAHFIIKYRKTSTIKTTKQLSDLVINAIPKKIRIKRKNHPATKIFMALRIAVNEELKNLNKFLDIGIKLLKSKGRFCVLSFNSLEDRIVKHKFKKFKNPCICPKNLPICNCNLKSLGNIISKKVIIPSKEEIKKNPMSRSTKLRIFEKI